MTRKEKKLYEQMRQYQPPEVETEKYCEMQKKAQVNLVLDYGRNPSCGRNRINSDGR